MITFDSMFKATVNNKSFEIFPDEAGFTVNGQRFQWDIEKLSEGNFHILHNNRSYHAEIVTTDRTSKSFVIKINGVIFPVALKDRFDLLLEKMGMTNTGSGKVNNIKAPMPGLIIDLKVKQGDQVKQQVFTHCAGGLRRAENGWACTGQALSFSIGVAHTAALL